MKFVIRGMLLLAAMSVLFACGDNNEDTYNFDELSTSLVGQTGEEIEVFASDSDAIELYLYFTGVS